MLTTRQPQDIDNFTSLDSSEIAVLSSVEERQLLKELGACKQKLADALSRVQGYEVPSGADDPLSLAQFISTSYPTDGPNEARLGAIHRRYMELRGKLALANMRLVAHIAKRFRDRGIPYSDLLQEGFCGLLESIDRFDLNHETKLATYATWWIRQSMQRAVASGAYPVRLTPRHLRQLAQNQEELERIDRAHADSGTTYRDATPNDMIQRIHTATRPTISLNSSYDAQPNFNLLQTMSDPEADKTIDLDTGEAIQNMMKDLRPREQQVLSLRFGLGGVERLSLSQVGKVLQVSKERVRQIQDRSLEKLRAIAEEQNLSDLLPLTS